MADNRIRFSIDSVFNGEGFKKATTSVKGIAGIAKSSADSMRGLTSELGQIGGKFSQVSDAAGKFFSSLSMGAIGVSVAITTYLVGAIVKYEQEQQKIHDDLQLEYEKLTSRWNVVMDNVARIIREKTEEALKASIERSQQAIEKLEKLTKAYDRLHDSVSNVAKAEASLKNSIIDLNVAGMAGIGGSDAQKMREIQAKIEKAENEYAAALEAATNAYSKANGQVGVMEEKVKELRNVYEKTIKLHGDSDKAEQDWQNARIALAAAENDLKVATKAKEQVIVNHELVITQLSNEEQKLRDEIQAREDKEAEARKNAEYRAAMEKKAGDEIEKLSEKTKKEIDAIDRKIKAQDEYIEAVKAEKARAQAGMRGSQNHEGGAFGQYGYSTDANGNINDFEDWLHAQNFAGWDERDAATKAAHDAALQKKADQLKAQQKKGKKLLDSEKKFLDNWEKYKKQKADLEAEEAKKKKLEQERESRLKRLDDNVKEIKKHLKEALEVK